MHAFYPVNLFMIITSIIIPAVVLYFVIKLAVKRAIQELKDEGII